MSANDPFYVPTYHLNDNEPCYCHSGKKLGQCCANPGEDRAVPASLKIVNNFISAAECKAFLRFAKKQPRSWLKVVESGDASKAKRDPARVTQLVDIAKKQQHANQWILDAVQQHVAPLGKPEWYEPPQLLRYGPGGKYEIHADAEHLDKAAGQFYRFIDRDFSFLVYLNDDYEGGEIYFNVLKYKYKPKAGDLVVFPSNHVFMHESMPVTFGTKYALVSWGAFVNTPRVMPPAQRINYF